jgi:ubiquinone/menaquinone biosynthesis C-methylase UbiE
VTSCQRGAVALTTLFVFVDESLWIRAALERAPLKAGMTVLDIGSSTLAFRTIVQPHIDANVFEPLRRRGIASIHLDSRAEAGVDIVTDVTRLDAIERTFDVVLCTNLLEHVVDRAMTLHNVKRVIAPAGLLVLTVPQRYRIHHDPIDTGFRPSAKALIELVGWPGVIQQENVTVRHPQHYLGKYWFRRWMLPWKIACLVVSKPLD